MRKKDDRKMNRTPQRPARHQPARTFAQQQIIQQRRDRWHQIKEAGDIDDISRAQQTVQQQLGDHRNQKPEKQHRNNQPGVNGKPEAADRGNQQAQPQTNGILQRQDIRRRLTAALLLQRAKGHQQQRRQRKQDPRRRHRRGRQAAPHQQHQPRQGKQQS